MDIKELCLRCKHDLYRHLREAGKSGYCWVLDCKCEEFMESVFENMVRLEVERYDIQRD